MAGPLQQYPRNATVAWCASEAAPSLMALGASARSAAAQGPLGDATEEAMLEFASFDLAKPGQTLDVVAKIRMENNRRFSAISWGALGVEGPAPYGVLAGGFQDGIVSLWDPHRIVSSHGSDQGMIHSRQVHQGGVHCVEFHPMKPSLLATCGADGEVNILSLDRPSQPDMFKPSEGPKTHAGSEVLSLAWNRKVPHILGSCSNKGTAVVWDLKQKKEVIACKDHANRLKCSSMAWNPEKPTQMLVAYDDDRNPSLQMWDLRNPKYPFKEQAGHSKGILSLDWSAADPNLILSCGKDNRIICWFNGSNGLESFCEIPGAQSPSEVHWAPFKPSIISAASYNGAVTVHSVQSQQTAGAKYCPAWYGRKGGVSFGFGGKVLAHGAKQAAATAAAAPPSSWCHSLVVPNEPEVVASADLFEQWLGERKFKEFCHDKMRKTIPADSHEGLMWDLLGVQFEDEGRAKVSALLGFDQASIEQETERFLGRKIGSTLSGAKEEQAATETQSAVKTLGPELQEQDADDFFKCLADNTERQRADDAAAAVALAAAVAVEPSSAKGDTSTDWSQGAELRIKQLLLVGNLAGAVECCFESGRMAEALLLASGGGTDLFKQAREEYLRLRGDALLSAVGNIMDNDFDQLVERSNLKGWKETLAIVATYARNWNDYSRLCERLGERLEKETFDIRSAVICYICAKNFPKTVGIWANTHVASCGSKKLALQDLVEKMAVLQHATKFDQADSLFNAKLTQYAEILANSGRLTAAMRYLCLLRDDPSSSILRDRIYNCAPKQMSQMFSGRQPGCPFQYVDVRVLHQEPQRAQPSPYASSPARHAQPAVQHHVASPRPPSPMQPMQPPAQVDHSARFAPQPPAPGPRPPFGVPQQQQQQQPAHVVDHAVASRTPVPLSKAPAPAGSALPPRPAFHSAPLPGPMPVPASSPAPGPMPSPVPTPPPVGSNLPPRPSINGPSINGSFQHSRGPMPGPAPGPVPDQGFAPNRPQTHHDLQHHPQHNPQHNGQSTAIQASAKPVIDGLPVPWPIPTKTQLGLSTTTTTAEANRDVLGPLNGAPVGEAMNPTDLMRIKSVLGMLLDTSAADGNTRKREETGKRLEELFAKLAAGQIKPDAAQKVLMMVQAIEAQDYATANKKQMELCAIDWDQNKNWLMSVKRLIPRA